MRPARLPVPLIPVSIFTVSLGLVAAGALTACGSGGSGAGGAGAGSGSGGANDCFDYTGFQTTPAVAFAADVLPIFRNSCGISSVCHGCDTPTTCTNSGIMPYLGPANMSPAPTPAQIAAIFAQTVGVSSTLQTSLIDGSQVGDPDMLIVAAGDPAHSFMMYKLDGDPTAADMTQEVSCSTLTCEGSKSCGGSMPSGGPQLPLTSRNIIRRWIAQGAKND